MESIESLLAERAHLPRLLAVTAARVRWEGAHVKAEYRALRARMEHVERLLLVRASMVPEPRALVPCSPIPCLPAPAPVATPDASLAPRPAPNPPKAAHGSTGPSSLVLSPFGEGVTALVVSLAIPLLFFVPLVNAGVL